MKLFEQQIKNLNDSNTDNSAALLYKLNKKNNRKEYCRRITTQYYTSGIKVPSSTNLEYKNIRYIRI